MAQLLKGRLEWSQPNSCYSSGTNSPKVHRSRNCIVLSEEIPTSPIAVPLLDVGCATGQLQRQPSVSRLSALHNLTSSSSRACSPASSRPNLELESEASSAQPPSVEGNKNGFLLPSPSLQPHNDKHHPLLYSMVDPTQRVFNGSDSSPPASPKTPTKPSLPPAPMSPKDLICTAETKPPRHVRTTSIKEKYGRIRQVIGRGSGGTVRLVQQSQGKLFAVKEFRVKRDTETKKEYLKKLTSEFCISSSLHHTNIVETLDLVFEDDHVFEIMEYCPHQLYRIAECGAMSVPEIDCCFVQMINAITYLQSMGIAHRDIKPENFVIDDLGTVKLIDFGCSVVYRTPFESKDKVLSITGLAGSEPYMAPEIFTRELYDPRRVDLWAIGIVYFAMSTQQLPWRVALPRDPHFKKYSEDPKYKDKMLQCLPSSSTRPLIRGLLTPDPVQRFTLEQLHAHPDFRSIDYCTPTKPACNHFHHLTYDI